MADRDFIPVRIAVLTVSDTRTAEDDRSGDTLAQRQADAERRATLAGQIGNRPAQAAHDFATDRQAQPGPACLGLTDASEFLENNRLFIGRNALAVVDEIHHSSAADLAHGDAQAGVVGVAIFGGIYDQIDKHLRQTVQIRLQLKRLARRFAMDADLAFDVGRVNCAVQHI